ncbi:hypothetical protein FACS189454_05680 [Planctomycetales bacterium]|nr:hypothetical protein FACS189454_05680 [Planctomycetales bacterium]
MLIFGKTRKHSAPGKKIVEFEKRHTASFSPGGKRVVTRGEGGTVRIWDLDLVQEGKKRLANPADGGSHIVAMLEDIQIVGKK